MDISWSTKLTLIVVIVLFVAATAVLVNNTVPLLAFKIPLGGGIEARIAVYDTNNGALVLIMKNVKFILESLGVLHAAT